MELSNRGVIWMSVELDDQFAVDNSKFEYNLVLVVFETDTILIRECNEDLSCEILPVSSSKQLYVANIHSLWLISPYNGSVLATKKIQNP